MIIALAAALAAPAAAAAQERPAVDGRRHALRMMEAVLVRSVLTGAEHLAEQLAGGNPNMSFFAGQARARGFMLDGYGVFFHVEIPEMQQSVVFSVTALDRDETLANALESLARVVESAPDSASKIQAELAMKRLQLQFGPPPAISPARDSLPPRGAIRSADAAVADNAGDPSAALLARDPNAAYRDAIKRSIVDAMLEHSRGMSLAPDEWLTVAAHRGESPLAPNEIVTSPTLILRIKGSDLALYDADRGRKEEIRGRVEVREF